MTKKESNKPRVQYYFIETQTKTKPISDNDHYFLIYL